jgi:hypothetical protein
VCPVLGSESIAGEVRTTHRQGREFRDSLSLSLLSIDHFPVLPSIAFCLFCSQIGSQEARVASRGFDTLAIAKFNGVTES